MSSQHLSTRNRRPALFWLRSGLHGLMTCLVISNALRLGSGTRQG